MTDPLFWMGFVVGLLVGTTFGVFVVGLVMATREERRDQGWNGH